jgi:hypothetical protein
MRVHFKLTVYANDLVSAKESVYVEASKFLMVSVEDAKVMLDLEMSVTNSFEETVASGDNLYQITAQANLKNSVVRPPSITTTYSL